MGPNSRYFGNVSDSNPLGKTVQKTVLHSQHQSLSARMLDFAGWDMPISYDSYSGGMRKEHLLVREDCGVFDVSHMGEFWFRGSDAGQFLDLASTRPMSSLSVGKARYALLLNESGFIIDDIIVYRVKTEEFMMVVNAANLQKDYSHLKRLHSGFKCEFLDKSPETALIAVQGPHAMDQLSALGLPQEVSQLPYYGLHITDDSLVIARTGYTGEDGFELFLPSERAEEFWKKALAAKIRPIGLGARDTLRLEVGFPLYGHELSEETYPHETLASFAVSKKHKDFHGSSFLAEAPRFFPVAILAENAKPIRENEILLSDNKKIGRTTSGSSSPVLKRGMGLALVERSLYPDGLSEDVDIFLESAGKQRKARITNLPFVETHRVKRQARKCA